MHRIMLAAVSREDRNTVIAAVTDTIHACNGWIIDSHLYSNISAALTFAVPSLSRSHLATALDAHGVKLDDDSRINLANTAVASPDPGIEVTICLQITFIHNEPDLRRTVIPVPG